MPGLVSATLLMVLATSNVHAVGLGQVNVQSALGQPLRASLALLGDDGARILGTCFNARLSSADGAFIVAPRIALTPGAKSATLTLSTTVSIAEPALSLLVEMGCGDGIRREFSLLLDPPMNPASTPVPLLETSSVGVASAHGARDRNTAAPVPGSETARTPVKLKLQDTAPRTVPAAGPAVTAEKNNMAGKRNVLRLTSNDGSDSNLINAIGLRLAQTNSLAEHGPAADVAAIPDLAKAAAARAAQARFAALLRDDGKADTSLPVTEQKLQELQSKMLMLETETLRLKQASQRDAAALSAARMVVQKDSLGDSWVVILAALLALCTGVIVWLLMRVNHLKQHNMAWEWEENVAATEPPPGEEATRHQPAPDPELFNEPPPVRHETVAAPRTPAPMPRPTAPGISAALEFMAAEPAIPARGNGISIDGAGAAAKAGVVTASAAVMAQPPADLPKPIPTPDEQDDLQFEEITVAAPAVEEISDVMQEAEFWISLRDSQRAIEVLEPYATVDHPTSPLPWLYLFELYADLGQRENYNVLHERFQRVFNGKIPTWTELEQSPPPPPCLRGVEDIPHIADKIVTLWSTGQIVPYLESLLLDDREGNRIGFDLPVYRDIMFLIGIAYDIQQSKKFLKPALGSPGWTIAA